MNLTENNMMIRLDSIGWKYDLETETRENRNETSDSIKGVKFS